MHVHVWTLILREQHKYSCDKLKKLGIAYHYALKGLVGLLQFYSNHFTCSILEKFTFTHMMNQASFLVH